MRAGPPLTATNIELQFWLQIPLTTTYKVEELLPNYEADPTDPHGPYPYNEWFRWSQWGNGRATMVSLQAEVGAPPMLLHVATAARAVTEICLLGDMHMHLALHRLGKCE